MTDIPAERIVDDVSVLKALADPIRMTLMDLTMGQPGRSWTARELAGEVGVLPTNIYYHLNMLERHGLLTVRDTRVVNGIIEKHYGAGQLSVTFHRRSAEPGSGDRELMVHIPRDKVAAFRAELIEMAARYEGRSASDRGSTVVVVMYPR